MDLAEAQAWLQIQQALLATLPHTIAGAAPEEHAHVHAKHCRSLAAVSGSLGAALSSAAAGAASSFASEAAAWGEIANAACAEAAAAATTARNAASVAALPPSAVAAIGTFASTDVVTEPRDSAAVAERAAEVARLEERQAALRREVAALEREHVAAAHALEQRKAESLAERTRLHGEIEGLRQAAAAETERLRTARSEAEHEERVLAEARKATAGATMGARGSSVGDMAASPSAALEPGGLLSSPRSRGTPSLEGGLQALQAVREQLREMRESSAGTPTALGTPGSPRVSTSAVIAVGASPVAQPVPVRHANSAYFAPDTGRPGTAPAGFTHAYSAGSFDRDDGAASPWKSRLLKLQGDLRALRSELSVTPQ